MSATPPATHASARRLGGWSLIAAAFAFTACFSWLAANFGYPEVLDGSAADVLPRLLGLGATGRAVWMVYALLPLLLVPAAIGAHGALGAASPTVVRVATVSATVSAGAMVLGLARWPSVHWALATAWSNAGPEGRVAIAATFDGLNTYLGNVIGEFLGELGLNGFFVLTGVALARTGRRRAGRAGIAAGCLGLVAALRNVTPLVGPAAALDNLVLPLWLAALGVLLLRAPRVP